MANATQLKIKKNTTNRAIMMQIISRLAFFSDLSCSSVLIESDEISINREFEGRDADDRTGGRG